MVVSPVALVLRVLHFRELRNANSCCYKIVYRKSTGNPTLSHTYFDKTRGSPLVESQISFVRLWIKSITTNFYITNNHFYFFFFTSFFHFDCFPKKLTKKTQHDKQFLLFVSYIFMFGEYFIVKNILYLLVAPMGKNS